jgi:hypothetical protein
MDPKREAQLKSSAEALAVLTFNFIQAIKRAAEDFQSGVEEIEKGTEHFVCGIR